MFVKSSVFVPGKPFQPSLMFVSKCTTLIQIGVFLRGSIQEGCGLYRKHQIKPERHDKDKHSSLLQTFIITDEKMFCNTWPRLSRNALAYSWRRTKSVLMLVPGMDRSPGSMRRERCRWWPQRRRGRLGRHSLSRVQSCYFGEFSSKGIGGPNTGKQTYIRFRFWLGWFSIINNLIIQ